MLGISASGKTATRRRSAVLASLNYSRFVELLRSSLWNEWLPSQYIERRSTRQPSAIFLSHALFLA